MWWVLKDYYMKVYLLGRVVPFASFGSMALKQKKREKNVRNRYLKPGALAQIRYSRTVGRLCTDILKKREVLDSKKAEMDLHKVHGSTHSTPLASPNRINFQFASEGSEQQKVPETPKGPQAGEYVSHSRLESLPMDLLVKIICNLHHDQLRAVFHVSQRIRTAVILARQIHFNYKTPERSRQEMLSTKTPLPTEHWPFVSKEEGKDIYGSSPHTPKAPKHGPRPPRSQLLDTKQVAAVLFGDSPLSSRFKLPPGLPRPVFKTVTSTRVLFCEDELCQAVAQNKLL